MATVRQWAAAGAPAGAQRSGAPRRPGGVSPGCTERSAGSLGMPVRRGRTGGGGPWRPLPLPGSRPEAAAGSASHPRRGPAGGRSAIAVLGLRTAGWPAGVPPHRGTPLPRCTGRPRQLSASPQHRRSGQDRGASWRDRHAGLRVGIGVGDPDACRALRCFARRSPGVPSAADHRSGLVAAALEGVLRVVTRLPCAAAGSGAGSPKMHGSR